MQLVFGIFFSFLALDRRYVFLGIKQFSETLELISKYIFIYTHILVLLFVLSYS